MKQRNRNPRVAILSRALTAAVLLSCAAVLTLPYPALAGHGNQGNPGVIPPQASPDGHTYSEWAAMWWQWAYSIPADINPVADPTGAFAAVGQSGRVWFLVGNFGGTTIRTATVPPGKALFFPIINSVWINVPDFGDDPWSDEQRAFARSIIAPFIDNAFDLSCTIDGVAVQHLEAYRTATADGAEYLITVPEDNITGFLSAGTNGPSVDDGIYLMLAPLKPGLHTIHITSASTGSLLGEFALDVTYHLTVE
jgi:hypothetical protein